jgi:hemolysin activation/secretion protein
MNPTKREALTFARSREPGKVDAEITVRDRDPRQAYVWLNNTGNEDTGDTRLGVGLQHQNLFDRDHSLTLTFTTSPEETDKVSQYGLHYEIPLYGLGGQFSLYAVNSDVDSGTVGDFFNVSGSGEFYGLRYSHILPKWGELRQRLIFEANDKLFDNEAEFSGVPVGVDVRSRPLSLQYLSEWDARRSSGHFFVGYYHNLDSGAFNDDASYAASRVGAEPDWSAWRAGASLRLPLPGQWLASALLDAQYTSEMLIPGEQFGAGGLASVRGFEEREITGDRGVMGRLELWSPPFGNRFRVGAFLDGGYVSRLDPQAGERATATVSSTGIGASWDWRTNLSAQLYYAYVLEGLDNPLPDETAEGDTKVHFSIIYRFF